MAGNSSREPMLDMFLFESSQLLEQLEQLILSSEKQGKFDPNSINEIFRIMHTIKGSSAMMLFNSISTLAHSVEDLFYYLREEKPKKVDHSKISDIVLESIDFTKSEIEKIEAGMKPDGDASSQVERIKVYLNTLKGPNPSKDKPVSDVTESSEKQKFYISSTNLTAATKKNYFKARITFEDGCEMENIRAFSVIHSLKENAEIIEHYPADIIDDEESVDIIRQVGFIVKFASEMNLEESKSLLSHTVFLKELEVEEIPEIKEEPAKAQKTAKGIVLEDLPDTAALKEEVLQEKEKDTTSSASKQSFISVNLAKLDKLMDLVGEMVISESLVTRNPEIEKLQIESFLKSSRQLRKITAELQDMVMSIRMVPLSPTFQKMNRIVRDMCKKLKKEVQLEIIGEETEVDKNIIENISDPLMHLIRNSLDHGIESAKDRISKGKPQIGKITLEARNSGGDVYIIVRDDGQGLNRDKILQKARAHGLTNKTDGELTERDIFSFVLMPGFSTNENVTEFSGRGVGMDVVVKNVEKVGGTVQIESVSGVGSTFLIKIPLTLAIIDGIAISVGKSSYIVPTVSIKESFKAKENDVFTDPDGNEMIIIRGVCYPVLRMHKLYDAKTDVTEIMDGILIMVEDDHGGLCLFADALIGEQQVVVKALPKYIKKINGLSGCTLLGDGNISLILDVGSLIKERKDR